MNKDIDLKHTVMIFESVNTGHGRVFHISLPRPAELIIAVLALSHYSSCTRFVLCLQVLCKKEVSKPIKFKLRGKEAPRSPCTVFRGWLFYHNTFRNLHFWAIYGVSHSNGNCQLFWWFIALNCFSFFNLERKKLKAFCEQEAFNWIAYCLSLESNIQKCCTHLMTLWLSLRNFQWLLHSSSVLYHGWYFGIISCICNETCTPTRLSPLTNKSYTVPVFFLNVN